MDATNGNLERAKQAQISPSDQPKSQPAPLSTSSSLNQSHSQSETLVTTTSSHNTKPSKSNSILRFVDSFKNKLHDELSTVAESCLEIKNRLKELAAKLDECSNQVNIHSTDISQLITVDQSHLEKIQALEKDIYDLRSNLMESTAQRQVLESSIGEPMSKSIDQETIEKLQVCHITSNSSNGCISISWKILIN